MDVLDRLAIALDVELNNMNAFNILAKGLTNARKNSEQTSETIQNLDKNLKELGFYLSERKNVANSMLSAISEYGQQGVNWVNTLITQIDKLANSSRKYKELQEQLVKLQSELNEGAKDVEEKRKTSEHFKKEVASQEKGVSRQEDELADLKREKGDLQSRLQDAKDRLSSLTKGGLGYSDAKKEVKDLQGEISRKNLEIQAQQEILTLTKARRKEFQDYSKEADKELENAQKLLVTKQQEYKLAEQNHKQLEKDFNFYSKNFKKQFNAELENGPKRSVLRGAMSSISESLHQLQPMMAQFSSAAGIPIDIFGTLLGMLDKVAGKLGVVATLMMIPAGMQWVKGYVEEWRKVNKQLALYSSNVKEYIEKPNGSSMWTRRTDSLQQKLMGVAMDTDNNYGDIANTFITLKRSMGGITQKDDDIVRFTKNLKNAFEADELTDAQSARVEQTLSRLMSAKSVNGRQLEQLIQTSPTLAKAIAESKGVSIGGLRNLANQKGGLSGKDLYEGVQKSEEAITKAAEKMPYTFSKAFSNISNGLSQMFSNLEHEFGFFDRMKHSLDGLREPIQNFSKWLAEADPKNVLTTLKLIAIIIGGQVLRQTYEWVMKLGVVKDTLENIKEKYKGIKNLFKDSEGNFSIEKQANAFNEWVENAPLNFKKKFSETTTSISEKFSNLKRNVDAGWTFGGFKGAMQGVKATIFENVNALGIMKGAFTGLLLPIKLVGAAIKMAFSLFGVELLLLVLEDIKVWFEGGESMIGSIIGPFNEFWGTVEKGEGVFGTVWKAFLSIMKNIVFGVGVLVGVWEGATENIGETWDKVLKVIGSIASGAFQGFIDGALLCIKPIEKLYEILKEVYKLVDLIFGTDLEARANQATTSLQELKAQGYNNDELYAKAEKELKLRYEEDRQWQADVNQNMTLFIKGLPKGVTVEGDMDEGTFGIGQFEFKTKLNTEKI